MKGLGGLVRFSNKNDNLLIGLIVLYLIFDVRMPSMVNGVLNSNLGGGVFLLLSACLLMGIKNNVLVVLGAIVVYEMLLRAKKSYRNSRVVGVGARHSGNKRMNTGFSNGYSLEEAMSNEVPVNGDKKNDFVNSAPEPLSLAPSDAAPFSN